MTSWPDFSGFDLASTPAVLEALISGSSMIQQGAVANRTTSRTNTRRFALIWHAQGDAKKDLLGMILGTKPLGCTNTRCQKYNPSPESQCMRIRWGRNPNWSPFGEHDMGIDVPQTFSGGTQVLKHLAKWGAHGQLTWLHSSPSPRNWRRPARGKTRLRLHCRQIRMLQCILRLGSLSLS